MFTKIFGEESRVEQILLAADVTEVVNVRIH